ncbi:hypothetical protein HOLleu_25075 [Holothuria leucospilota]|uniref:Ig-like domain-containing protein n=1 Tax=Holothuria leucospilota TaxID=206669 RepID=A0A9Q1H382_HOLLE|nr:hypothetical protein HOLleu_25075 [Holothuria leucospilota]
MLRYALFPLLVLGNFHHGNGENFCKSSAEIQVIHSFLQKNTTMMCIISKECTNVCWKRHADDGSGFEMTSGTRKFDDSEFSVDTSLTLGQTVLSVINVSKNLAGAYSCHCVKKIENSSLHTYSTEGCFNLTTNTLKCQMQAEIQGKRQLTYEATHLRERTETVEAAINDVLSVKCLNGGQKSTNCSELDHPYCDIPLRRSDTWCEFSCTITNYNATCELRIILNVTGDEQCLPFAPLWSTESTGYSSTMVSTEKSQSQEPSTETTTGFMYTSTADAVTEAPIDLTEVTTPPLTEGTTYFTNTGKANKKEPANFIRKTLICIIIIIAGLFIITAMLQSFYIISLQRQDHRRDASHESWQNPVYDSIENDNVSHNTIPERACGEMNSQRIFEPTCLSHGTTCHSQHLQILGACLGDGEKCEEGPSINTLHSNIKIKPSGKVVTSNKKKRAKIDLGVKKIGKPNIKANKRTSGCPTENNMAHCDDEAANIMKRMNSFHIYEDVARI